MFLFIQGKRQFLGMFSAKGKFLTSAKVFSQARWGEEELKNCGLRSDF